MAVPAEAVTRKQLAGLVLGFAGVVALLGLDFSTQIAALLGAGAVLLSAAGYAASALLYRRWLPHARALGVSTLMMLCSCGVFALPAAADLPRHMPGITSLLALITLGIVNTGLLSWVYFALVREAGAGVTSLITYVVPVVALVLGVGLLGETLTIGAIVGLALIALGTWLATNTRRPRLDRRPAGARTESAAPAERDLDQCEVPHELAQAFSRLSQGAPGVAPFGGPSKREGPLRPGADRAQPASSDR